MVLTWKLLLLLLQSAESQIWGAVFLNYVYTKGTHFMGPCGVTLILLLTPTRTNDTNTNNNNPANNTIIP